jgi:hypothetical protein
MAKPKRPRDTNQLAKMVVAISTGEVIEPQPDEKRQAVLDARRTSGLKGAKARAKAITPGQRSAIASIAAQARWKKKP